MGKGDTRRPGVGYAEHWGRIFESDIARDANAPIECPHCKEIALQPTTPVGMWQCTECNHEVQI